MKKNSSRDYYINSSNTHLLNVLEDNYYIEIGVIGLNKIDKLLEGQVLDLTEFIYFDILNDGIGKITSDTQSDVYFQLNYLLSYRQKVSTKKFFLTCGLIKYRDEKGIERYAPIVLIPIDIDYQKGKIWCSSEAIPNRLLLRLLAKYKFNTQDEQNKYVDTMLLQKFQTIGAIDKFCLDVSADTELDMSPVNYLTVCRVEYYDFAIDNNFFTPERSIYETDISNLYHEFYQNIKAVLPTNIYQKHVLLKAHNGESFGVDGRLGSGKTYTIINMLADFLASDKHVLYVDQDLDNIWDVEKNLRYLNLSNNIHNLTTKTREIDVEPVILKDITDSKFNYEPLNFFDKLDEAFAYRIHGFSFEYLVENIAVIKQKYPNLFEVTIELDLERSEYEHVSKLLRIIEARLLEVDEFKTNIWRNLQTAYNNISNEDVSERTKNIYSFQKKICNKIDNFCSEYGIVEPKNIHDLYRFIEHVLSFEVAKPQPNWKNDKNRVDAKRVLKEIQQHVDENYYLQQFYKNNIDERYEPGRMLEILEEICGKHLSITKDQIYINRLLSSSSKLHSLSETIKLNITNSKTLYDNMKAYFGIDKYTEEIYSFLNECYQFLSKNRIPRNLTKLYLDNPKALFTIGEKITNAWKSMMQAKNDYGHYLLPAVSLNYEDISQVINTKKAKRVLLKYFDTNAMHQNHIDRDEVFTALNNYYLAGNILKSELVQGIDKYDYEKYWGECVNFYELLCNNMENAIYLQTLLKKQISTSPFDNDKIITSLHDFKNEIANTASLIAQLKNYHIIIEDKLPVEQLIDLASWNRYLTNVISLKNEIAVIFKSETHVTLSEIVELIDIDNQYLELTKVMNENEKEYKRLLGDNYKRFDTIISDTGQSLEHFDDFIIRLNDPNDVDKLLKTKTYERFLADTTELRGLHSEWISCFRLFSVCFQNGQSALHNRSFKDVLSILEKYNEKVDQVPKVTEIINCIFHLNKYCLRTITNGIKNGKYKENISVSLSYTLFMRYLQKFNKELPILIDFNWIQEQFMAYEQTEEYYCIRNIKFLLKNNQRLGKTRNTNISFYEYNRFVETTFKNTNIYLADLNIFNTDLDLSVFDLVIIDDGHLSSANKYNRIMECKQAIIFGDKFFQSSVSNSLVQRMKDSTFVNYANRYVKMSPKFNNNWSQNNRYIYALETPIKVHQIESIQEFAVKVVEYFKQHETSIINVLIGNDISRREVYESIVKLLQMTHSPQEIVEILCYNIRIINVNDEGSRYVNDVFIYYSDFVEYELPVKNLIFKNFVVVDNSIQIFYANTLNDVENKNIIKEINSLIARQSIKQKKIDGISEIFLKKLTENDIKAEAGFGKFDIIIQGKTNYAIIFEGKENNHSSSLIDDYQYYLVQYTQRGWKVKIIYVYDLIDNFDTIFNDTIKFINQGSENENK